MPVSQAYDEGMLEKIPRKILVPAVIICAVGLFFVIREPHSRCDSQSEVFVDSERGLLFPKQVNNQTRPPAYPKAMGACKSSNSPGGCYEIFRILSKLEQDLRSSPQECLSKFGEIGPVRQALSEGLMLLTMLAWGDSPPADTGMSKFSWLEAPDLSLFCHLKNIYKLVYGDEAFESLRLSIQGNLPMKAKMIEGLNPSMVTTTTIPLSNEEIWARSLFSVRCDNLL